MLDMPVERISGLPVFLSFSRSATSVTDAEAIL